MIQYYTTMIQTLSISSQKYTSEKEQIIFLFFTQNSIMLYED